MSLGHRGMSPRTLWQKCFPQKIRHPKIYLSSEQRTRYWPEGPLNGKDLIITLIFYILGKFGCGYFLYIKQNVIFCPRIYFGK